ncbi:MAG: hypothetical protein ABH870_05890 [bacterium]
MRRVSLFISIVTISIVLVACNSVRHNPNSSTTQNETSKPSTETKAISLSQTVESETQNSTSDNSKLGILSEKYESCGDPGRITYESEPSPIPMAGVKADGFYIEEIVTSYERLLTYAINDNEFSLIKDLLMPESDICQSQEKFVAEQVSKGIKYERPDVCTEIKKGSKKNEYKVYVTGNVEISEPNKAKEIKEIKCIYTVIDDGNIRKITDIHEENGGIGEKRIEVGH